MPSAPIRASVLIPASARAWSRRTSRRDARIGGDEEEPRTGVIDEHQRIGGDLEPAGLAKSAEEPRLERVSTVAPDRRAHDLKHSQRISVNRERAAVAI